jgi:hypothetical protein
VADACKDGQCNGASKVCFDENLCTTDACVDGACVYLAIAATCSDGDSCTTGDYCALGQCIAGAPEACDDGLDCTLDSCIDGACQHAGARQAESRTCITPQLVEIYDVCGGGPSWVECPADQPCQGGVCGGSAGGALDAGGDVTSTAPSHAVQSSTSSGCSVGAPASPPAAGCSACAALVIAAWLAVRLQRRRTCTAAVERAKSR